MRSAVSRRSFITGSALAATGLFGGALLAGCSPKASAAEGAGDAFESTVEWGAEYDVVVVGFGGAGANSAIAAADEGASVLLLEKAPEAEAGGNSIACMQLLCWSENLDDAIAYVKAMRGDYDTPSDAIIEAYCAEMVKNKEWIEYLGAETPAFVEGKIEYPDMAGAQSFRVLTVHEGRGDGAAYKLFRQAVADRSDKIAVWYEAAGQHLIQDPLTGIVHGVEVQVDGQVVNVRARNGVILTTGGYESNDEMLESFNGYHGWESLGHALYNTGDGIKMAMEVGCDLWHMGNLQTNNFEFVDPDTLDCTWKYDSDLKGILVGGNGTRFISETDTGATNHGHLNYAGTWHVPVLPEVTYEVLDQTVFERGPLYKSWSADGQEEIEKGWILKADSLEQLAAAMGFDEEAAQNLQAEVDKWNRFCDEGVDLAYGRKGDLDPVATAPFYAVKLTHTLVNTQGGPVKNEQGQVVTPRGEAVPHLYEAGELGDIWSNHYQGSCNLGGGMIFGRISGRNAAAAKTDNLQESVMDGKPSFVPSTLAAFGEEVDLSSYEVADGELLGTAEGKKGPIVVKVACEGTTITAVEVLEQNETPSIAGDAIASMPASIVEAGSVDVDVVSGATITSKAIIAAVEDAMSKA